MKKIVFLLFFLLTTNQYSIANVTDTIDKEHQKCLETNFQSDYTMVQCNYEAIKKYNIEIEKLIKKFKKITSQSQYYLLIQSQKTWEEFIKNDNALLENIFENKFYFEPYLISSNIKFGNYRQRYQELNDIYEYVNNNNSILSYKKNEIISLNEFLHAKDAPKNWKHLNINKNGDVIYRNKVIITDNGTSINDITASESYLLLKIFLIASGAEPKEDCDTSDYKNGVYGLGCYIYESE